MIRRFELKSLDQTCSACPSQWEGRTTDDQYVYVRFRWGGLSVSVDPVEDRVYVDGMFRAHARVSDCLDGYMTTEQMLVTAREVLDVELVVS